MTSSSRRTKTMQFHWVRHSRIPEVHLLHGQNKCNLITYSCFRTELICFNNHDLSYCSAIKLLTIKCLPPVFEESTLRYPQNNESVVNHWRKPVYIVHYIGTLWRTFQLYQYYWLFGRIVTYRCIFRTIPLLET